MEDIKDSKLVRNFTITLSLFCLSVFMVFCLASSEQLLQVIWWVSSLFLLLFFGVCLWTRSDKKLFFWVFNIAYAIVYFIFTFISSWIDTACC